MRWLFGNLNAVQMERLAPKHELGTEKKEGTTKTMRCDFFVLHQQDIGKTRAIPPQWIPGGNARESAVPLGMFEEQRLAGDQASLNFGLWHCPEGINRV